MTSNYNGANGTTYRLRTKQGKYADLKIGHYKQSGVETPHSNRVNSRHGGLAEVGPYNCGAIQRMAFPGLSGRRRSWGR